MNITTIVLINGLWMTALSWEFWVKHYTDRGYSVIAANWPGMEGEVEQLRGDSTSFATLGLIDVVDHYEQIIRKLETPRIIIGHSCGGLVSDTNTSVVRAVCQPGAQISSGQPASPTNLQHLLQIDRVDRQRDAKTA